MNKFLMYDNVRCYVVYNEVEDKIVKIKRFKKEDYPAHYFYHCEDFKHMHDLIVLRINQAFYIFLQKELQKEKLDKIGLKALREESFYSYNLDFNITPEPGATIGAFGYT